MSNGSSSPSSHFHHASAFGIAGQINRPTQQTINTQAAISLAPSGGHGTHRVDNFSAPGVLSFSAAYVEVGGSFDAANNGTHTTYSTSVVENLNIYNIVTADRIVSRLTIYHPDDPSEEPSFSIAGSYFDNLKIAGQQIDVQLDYETFHDSTYTRFANDLKGPHAPNRHVLMASNIDLDKLPQTDHNYGIVCDAAKRYVQWNPTEEPPVAGQHFWCSAANRQGWARPLKNDTAKPPGASLNNVPQPVPKPGEVANFGGVICVPRFGVIYLAEVVVHRRHRHLTMIRVRMCSPSDGFVDGPGSSGGGGDIPPRP